MAEKPSVILLGTGGPRPDPSRDGPATLIRFGDDNLLFDTGRGVVKQLVRAGVALAEVNPVFVTHHHYDHIGDLHDVVLSSWLGGRQQSLRIFGPPETRRIVNALLTQIYDKDIEFRDQGGTGDRRLEAGRGNRNRGRAGLRNREMARLG